MILLFNLLMTFKIVIALKKLLHLKSRFLLGAMADVNSIIFLGLCALQSSIEPASALQVLPASITERTLASEIH